MDFDRVIERRGTGSTKWERYPADVLPLWVADMDFASPPAVTEALRACAEHAVYGYARVPESLVEACICLLEERFGASVETRVICQEQLRFSLPKTLRKKP